MLQWQLKDHYARADVLVLPSRGDGFGVDFTQALASGLPIAFTSHTGDPDLRLTPEISDRISVVKPDDAEALAQALTTALDRHRA
jgi:glycosyltransferase involved in cell wall biosynthesis